MADHVLALDQVGLTLVPHLEVRPSIFVDRMHSGERALLTEEAAQMLLRSATADGSLQSKLADAGMTVNVADRAAFVEASKPIYKQFAAEVPTGQALIDAALALAE